MSEPFLGQIIATGFGFAPNHFALCNGQLLPVNQNQALFSLLGVMYGGNGSQTFALPDLRGRYPLGAGASVDGAWQPTPAAQGAPQGVEAVALTAQQIPVHNHPMAALSAAATDGSPASQFFATASDNAYGPATNLVGLAGGPMTPSGAGAHANSQPSRVISFSIALSGLWPSRN